MNRIIIILTSYCFLFSTAISHGQCYDSDDAVLNRAKNIKTPFQSTVNIFDWRVQEYSYYISNKASGQTEFITRPSPFFRTTANLSIKHLQDQIIKDFEPGDGWEFVQKNFGKPNDPVEVPWFILYNRHESMMRTFFYVPANLQSEYTSGKIKVRFIKNQQAGSDNLENAMLSFANTPAKALDKFEKNVTATVLNYVNTDGNYWLYGDFSIAYDPCVCNYFTNIVIEPFLTDVTQANLIQDNVDINDTKIAAPTSSNPISNLLGAIGNLTNAVGVVTNKGTAISKSVTSALNFLEKDYFPTVKRYETKDVITEESFKDAFLIYPQPSVAAVEIKTPAITFPPWMKELPSIGYFIGAFEYFAGGGKSQPTPAMSIIKQKFKISGDLTRSKSLTPIDLYVPGSDWSGKGGNTLSQPKYDNTMGVLNLVETLRVSFTKDKRSVLGPRFNRFIQGQEWFSNIYYVEMWNFKLNDDIKYAINPASGYKQTPVDIKAKLVFVADAQCLQGWNPERGLTPRFCTMNAPIFSSLKITKYPTSDSVIIETPLMPLSCIKEYVAHIAFAGNTKEFNNGIYPFIFSALRNLEKDARLQIVAVLEREDNPNANKFTFTAQYKLFPDELAAGSIANTPISDIAINPVIENLNLTADKTIRAWETATFKGTINTNGFQLKVIAGKSVDITNVIDLPTNVDISIGVPTECQGIVLPQSPSQLYNFCGKSGVKKYNPIAPVQGLVSFQVDTTPKFKTPFIISPNPFSNTISLEYSIVEDQTVTIDLANALGQTVKSLNFGTRGKGSYQETIETPDIAPGVYFLTLRTQNGSETKKIVKQ